MTIVALDLETFMRLTAPPPERPIMTNQQAPEIYTLHTVLNKGERPWSGIYGVRADAEHDAKVMRDVTGRHWSVVRLVVADTAAPQADSQPAVQQGDATRAAARALSDRVAEMCNVDKEDHWKYHSDDVLSDAELVISTYLAARAPADSVTAPAGGANWQDISTAPKDGTRFVAVGQNYGLDSEKQHTCIAQRLAGCWVEVSDWNGASQLKYLTHWMPLPPLPGSAARKQGANHD